VECGESGRLFSLFGFRFEHVDDLASRARRSKHQLRLDLLKQSTERLIVAAINMLGDARSGHQPRHLIGSTATAACIRRSIGCIGSRITICRSPYALMLVASSPRTRTAVSRPASSKALERLLRVPRTRPPVLGVPFRRGISTLSTYFLPFLK